MSDTTLSSRLQNAFFHKLCTSKRKRWQVSSTSSSTPRHECSATSGELVTACSRLSHDRIKLQFRMPYSLLAPSENSMNKKRKRERAYCSKPGKQRGVRKPTHASDTGNEPEVLPSELQVLQEIAALSYYPKIMLDCWRQKRKQCSTQQVVVDKYKEELNQCQHKLQVATTLFEMEKSRRQELRNEKQQTLNKLHAIVQELEYEKDYLKNLSAVSAEFDAKLLAVEQDNVTVKDLQERSANVLELFKKYESQTKSEYTAMRKQVQTFHRENARKSKELSALLNKQLLAECEIQQPEQFELKKDLEQQLTWCQMKEKEMLALIAMNSRSSGANIRRQLQFARQSFQGALNSTNGSYPAQFCFFIAAFWRYLTQCSAIIARRFVSIKDFERPNSLVDFAVPTAVSDVLTATNNET